MLYLDVARLVRGGPWRTLGCALMLKSCPPLGDAIVEGDQAAIRDLLLAYYNEHKDSQYTWTDNPSLVAAEFGIGQLCIRFVIEGPDFPPRQDWLVHSFMNMDRDNPAGTYSV